MKLAIISATPMYGMPGEPLEVYEPTLREIESISGLFEEITWLGYLKGGNPGNARKPASRVIRLGSLPVAEGGESLFAKFRILPKLPRLVLTVFRTIQHHDVIHSRGPAVPAFVCIVLSFFFPKKKFWHKYAGNWMEPKPPFMYQVQKWLLTRAGHTNVTVNGNWPDQATHVVSLENPGFTEQERDQALRVSSDKKFELPITFCFAGLMDESKGVPALVRAFSRLKNPEQFIQKLILAGHGPAMDEIRKLAADISVPVEFTGYIQRDRLNEIYRISHVLVLPSRTEGFPKVVAEAASFGCIPIVTNVSSIGQYVRDGVNGFVLDDGRPETIASALERLKHHENLSAVSEAAKAMSTFFTYERFRNAIANQILADIPTS
jgi:glycosyltransferase involved in cell wall biosynthesis